MRDISISLLALVSLSLGCSRSPQQGNTPAPEASTGAEARPAEPTVPLVVAEPQIAGPSHEEPDSLMVQLASWLSPERLTAFPLRWSAPTYAFGSAALTEILFLQQDRPCAIRAENDVIQLMRYSTEGYLLTGGRHFYEFEYGSHGISEVHVSGGPGATAWTRLRVTYVAGRVHEIALAERESPRGRWVPSFTIQLRYDANGRVESAGGRTFEYSDDRIVTESFGGELLCLDRDEGQRITRERVARGSEQLDHGEPCEHSDVERLFEYDPSGRLVAFEDAGHWFDVLYDCSAPSP